jgi:hypothetical protein
MTGKYLPNNVPPVYRGGISLTFQPHELRLDKQTGMVLPSHGISVDSELENVVKFGGAYLVKAIPHDLTIVQRGRRESHYEIVPRSPMPPERFQELLDQIELELQAGNP